MSNSPTKAEIEQRVIKVGNFILEGVGYSEIVRNGSALWGVKSRSIDKYIRKAREIMRTDSILELEESKAFHLRVRLENFKELTAEKKKILENEKLTAYKRTMCLVAVSKQISDILKDMAKIDGLYIERLDHTSGGQPIGKSLWDE